MGYDHAVQAAAARARRNVAILYPLKRPVKNSIERPRVDVATEFAELEGVDFSPILLGVGEAPASEPAPQTQPSPASPVLRVLPGGRAAPSAASETARLRELYALASSNAQARDRLEEVSVAFLEALALAQLDGIAPEAVAHLRRKHFIAE